MEDARVTCQTCGTGNPAERRYCKRCGSPLGAAAEVVDAGDAGTCPRCSAPFEPGDLFCGRCGFRLRDDPSTTGLPVQNIQQSAERRQLTVMFCDLVDSTKMSAALDPEDVSEVTRAYQRTVSDVVLRFDGFVARYMGDGVLAYFGYPRAHGDDPERAVHAGLEIVGAVGGLTSSLGHDKGVELHVRVGIATGLVVVGDLIGEGAASERAVVGETPNLAARLQGLAQPDSVVVSQSTRNRLGSRFRLDSLGEHTLKGFAEPVEAFRVAGHAAAGHTTRFMRDTPLVGREQELSVLNAEWARAEHGDCRRVVICGEPGIGKTHLVRALLAHIGRRAHVRIRLRGSPYNRRSPLFAVSEWLARQAKLEDGASDQDKLAALQQLLARNDIAADALPFLAHILSIPLVDESLAGDPQTLSDRTREAVVSLVVGLASGKPLLLVAEDAQWLDPSTRTVLDTLARRPGLSALSIVTHQPEIEEPWETDERTTFMELGRISDDAIGELIGHLTEDRTLPPAIKRAIVAKAGGIPLFAEELTRTVLDDLAMEGNSDLERAGALPDLAIPGTLQDSIMARLDRLGYEKAIIQIAAVIGRDVPRELLQAVTKLSNDELNAAIVRLIGEGLLVSEDGETLAFHQSLVQETAYESLLRARRRKLHARIAALLPEVAPAMVEQAPERLAHHLAEAGQSEEAITHWLRAADRAVDRFAVAEAIGHLEAALESLALLPEAEQVVDREIQVRLRIVELARTADVRAHAFAQIEQAEALAREHKRTVMASEVHHQWGNLCFLRGDIDDCERHHMRARDLAREAASPEHEAKALGGLGDAHYFRGRMATAYETFRACVSLCEQHGLGWVEAANRHMLGWTLAWLGRMDEAAEQATAGAELAARVGHSRAEMIAHGGAASIATERARLDEGRAAVEQSLELARKLGSTPFEAAMEVHLARLEWLQGRRDDAYRMAEHALATARAARALPLTGAAALGLVALTTPAPERQRAALREGEELLESPGVGHNHFWYRMFAMDACLQGRSWAEAERHAAALDDCTRAEPLLATTLYADRGRALARAGRGDRTEDVRSELEAVASRLREQGMLTALAAVEAALARS